MLPIECYGLMAPFIKEHKDCTLCAWAWGNPYRMEIGCLLFGWYSGVKETKFRSIINGKSMEGM
jgi:hypothetical protein